MQQSRLEAIRHWFDGYVHTFDDIDPEGFRNILLKIEHTHKVCEVMELLAAGEGLAPEETRLAGAIALLHDVGRFPQYRRWRTFRDSDSDNHARLGLEVIREQRILEELPPAERLLIEEAVRFHNLLAVPERVQSPTDLFIRLIRDADKLDIWRVFVELNSLAEHERASAACLGLPDLPEVTPVCLEALLGKQVVRLEQCRVVNDFRLLQISWTWDLNFPTSYRLLLERNYIPQLASAISGPVNIAPAVALITEEISRRAQRETAARLPD